jgi:hypothetical protein
MLGGTLSVGATLTLFVDPALVDLSNPTTYAALVSAFQAAMASALGLEPSNIIVRSIVIAPIVRRQLQTAATQPIEVGRRCA